MHRSEKTYPWQKEIYARGLDWKPEIEARFDSEKVQAYYDFLCEHSYFFSREDAKRILERHIYESLVFCMYVSNYLEQFYKRSVSRETSLLDAGSGPGLPGFLFACQHRTPSVFLLDASHRKLGTLAHWVTTCMREKDMPIHFIYERLEEHQAYYDCIVARALLPFPAVLELCCHLQKKKGTFVLFASRLKISEESKEYCRKLGYVSRETIFPPELQFLGLRRILILEKTGNSSAGYPRSWKQIKDSVAQWKN